MFPDIGRPDVVAWLTAGYASLDTFLESSLRATGVLFFVLAAVGVTLIGLSFRMIFGRGGIGAAETFGLGAADESRPDVASSVLRERDLRAYLDSPGRGASSTAYSGGSGARSRQPFHGEG